jgi:hypothetical protein
VVCINKVVTHINNYMQNNNFTTPDFQWFTGVIEDVNDPEQLSRVRVRCFGYHTDNLNKVPKDSLPWASVVSPTTSAGISGVGTTPHALVNGSWVFGFFRDGIEAQDPVVVGSLPSMYGAMPPKDIGFVDPDEVYPKEQGGDLKDLKDVNILARGINTIKDYFSDKISNPPSFFGAKYPHNKVTQTTSGHIFEVDDTSGAERIRIYHKSGTFTEIHPDGAITHKNGDKWQITAGEDRTHVSGNMVIHVDKTATINVGADANIAVEGNTEVVSTGSINLTGDTGINLTSKAPINIQGAPVNINGAVTWK